MLTSETIAIASLAGAVLLRSVAAAWKGGSDSRAMQSAIGSLERQTKRLEEEFQSQDKKQDDLPVIRRQVEQTQTIVTELARSVNHSIRPDIIKHGEWLRSLDMRVNSIKNMRAPNWRGSKPDDDGEKG